ncbi:MAG TPA: sugar nucleotide-binding protein [Pirellulales bacterium]
MENRVLIIGVDTLAGCNLALSWADRCELIGISRDRSFQLEGCRVVPLDAHVTSEIADVAADELPSLIVYCGAAARSSWDWNDEVDFDLESRRAEAICQAARNIGCPLTMVTTDTVFTGPQMFQREDHDLWIARDDRSRSWVRGVELRFLEASALVVRSHLYGWGPSGWSYAEQLQTAIEENRPFRASGNRYATPILASDFAVLLWAAHHRQLSGLYHLGGAQRCSGWEFAIELAMALGMPWKGGSPSLGLRADEETREKSRLSDEESSLDSRKLQREMHISIPMLREGVERFVAQATNGHRDRVWAALNRLALATSAA